jgi:hypothetical protein
MAQTHPVRQETKLRHAQVTLHQDASMLIRLRQLKLRWPNDAAFE